MRLAELESSAPSEIVDRGDDELAALLYTGGTTGRAKGVMLTHRGLSYTGQAAQQASHIPGITRSLGCLPLSHAYGLLVTLAGLHTPDPPVAVLLLGPAVPAVGDDLIVRRVADRWVTERGTAGGGGGPTAGFELCCPSNPMPAMMTITFTFRAGTDAHTYYNSLQNTTLTYFATRPPYDGGTGGFTPKYVSPVYLDDGSEECFLIIGCSGGQFFLQRAQAATSGVHASSPGSSCGIFGTAACSPFLLTGYANGGSVCAAMGFGAPGDNVTVSG